MGLSVTSRVWRAGIVACGLAWFGAAELRAETSGAVRTGDVARAIGGAVRACRSLPSPSGGLRDKWLGVQRRLDDEMVQLALCEGDRDGCASRPR